MTLATWFYFAGALLLGPFTDRDSCDSARKFQVDNGVRYVSVCMPSNNILIRQAADQVLDMGIGKD